MRIESSALASHYTNGPIVEHAHTREGSSVGDEEHVGTRIRALRGERKLGQSEVADAIGVRPQTVYRYEKGLIAPSAEAAVRLAEVLGVTAKYLVTGEEDGADTDAVGEESYPALAEFLSGAEGQYCTPDEVAQLRAIRFKNWPTAATYHYVLQGIRAQEPRGISVEAAERMAAAQARGLAMGGRIIDPEKPGR